MQILSLLPSSFDGLHYLKFLAAVVLGILIVAVVGRLVFGKKSTLNRSVSCGLGILCIYGVHFILFCTGVKLDGILTSLPFMELDGDRLLLFSFAGAGLTSICREILDMLILALVMVLVDNFIPQGKKFFRWLGWRLVSVGLCLVGHWLLCLLLSSVIPAGFLTSAPVILVIALLATLLLGTLKLIIGGALAFLSPVLAILYAFFFKNLIGKQIRKAVLTTAILSGLLVLFKYLGIGSVVLGGAFLLVYLGALLIVFALWFLVSRIF